MKAAIARISSLFGGALVLCATAFAQPEEDYMEELSKLDIIGLMNEDITSVTRHHQPVGKAAAAVSVITKEEILRSGARSIPEMLRLAPGVTVQRVSANNWNVTIRGFDSNGSAKLLVLLDGRSIYTPLFSGVFWDEIDVAPEDIERIEVIRGPGAVSWGENAVNGVINIITTASSGPEGTRVVGAGGKEEEGFGSVHHTGRLGSGTSYRIGSRFHLHDQFEERGGGGADDDYGLYAGSLRVDSKLSDRDALIADLNIYGAESGVKRTVFTGFEAPFTDLATEDTDLGGGHILGRWTRALDGEQALALQSYYSRTNRSDSLFKEDRDTYDVDFQHRMPIGEWQHLTWGANFRVTSDDTRGSPGLQFIPESETDLLATAFLLDELVLTDIGLTVIPGAKVGYNDYSAVEFQPSLRALKSLNGQYSLWGGVSRAVRSPARIDDDLVAIAPLPPSEGAPPTFFRLEGSSRFDSEKLIAYELGFRGEPAPKLGFDVAGFWFDYDDLLSIEPRDPEFQAQPPPGHVELPIRLANELHGRAYGGEAYVSWTGLDWVAVSGWYSYINIDFSRRPGSMDPVSSGVDGATPQHQANLRLHFPLPHGLSIDAISHYVDSAPASQVRSYIRQDLHLGWRATDRLSLHLYAQNLFDSEHREAASERQIQIERAIFAKLVYGIQD